MNLSQADTLGAFLGEQEPDGGDSDTPASAEGIFAELLAHRIEGAARVPLEPMPAPAPKPRDPLPFEHTRRAGRSAKLTDDEAAAVLAPAWVALGDTLPAHDQAVRAEPLRVAPGPALGALITKAAPSGPQRLTVELQPASLGKLTVDIRVVGRTMSLTFTTATPQAAAQLQQSIPQLMTQLSTHGWVVESISLKTSGVSAETRGTASHHGSPSRGERANAKKEDEQ